MAKYLLSADKAFLVDASVIISAHIEHNHSYQNAWHVKARTKENMLLEFGRYYTEAEALQELNVLLDALKANGVGFNT